MPKPIPTQKDYIEAKGACLKIRAAQILKALDSTITLWLSREEKKFLQLLKTNFEDLNSSEFSNKTLDSQLQQINQILTLLYQFSLVDNKILSENTKKIFITHVKEIEHTEQLEASIEVDYWVFDVLKEGCMNLQKLFDGIEYRNLEAEYDKLFESVEKSEKNFRQKVAEKDRLALILKTLNESEKEKNQFLKGKKNELQEMIEDQIKNKIIIDDVPKHMNYFEEEHFDPSSHATHNPSQKRINDFSEKDLRTPSDSKSDAIEHLKLLEKYKLHKLALPDSVDNPPEKIGTAYPVQIPILRRNKLIGDAIKKGLLNYRDAHGYYQHEMRNKSWELAHDDVLQDAFEKRVKRESHPMWRQLLKDMKHYNFYGFHNEDFSILFSTFKWYKDSANRFILGQLRYSTSNDSISDCSSSECITLATRWLNSFYNFEKVFISDQDELICPLFELERTCCSIDKELKRYEVEISNLKENIKIKMNKLNQSVASCNTFISNINSMNEVIKEIHSLRNDQQVIDAAIEKFQTYLLSQCDAKTIIDCKEINELLAQQNFLPPAQDLAVNTNLRNICNDEYKKCDSKKQELENLKGRIVTNNKYLENINKIDKLINEKDQCFEGLSHNNSDLQYLAKLERVIKNMDNLHQEIKLLESIGSQKLKQEFDEKLKLVFNLEIESKKQVIFLVNKLYNDYSKKFNSEIDHRVNYLKNQVKRMGDIILTFSIYKNRGANNILQDSVDRFTQVINHYTELKLDAQNIESIRRLDEIQIACEEKRLKIDLWVFNYCTKKIGILDNTPMLRCIADRIRWFFRGIIHFFSESCEPRYIRAKKIFLSAQSQGFFEEAKRGLLENPKLGEETNASLAL